MSGYVGGTYDEVAFGIPDDEDGMEILWSRIARDGTAAIMRDGDVWWICVNGQALKLTKADVLELVRLAGNEVNRP